jgi:hypothetical protein
VVVGVAGGDSVSEGSGVSEGVIGERVVEQAESITVNIKIRNVTFWML